MGIQKGVDVARIDTIRYYIVFEHEDFGQFKSVKRWEEPEKAEKRAKDMKEILPDWTVYLVKFQVTQDSSENWEEIV